MVYGDLNDYEIDFFHMTVTQGCYSGMEVFIDPDYETIRISPQVDGEGFTSYEIKTTEDWLDGVTWTPSECALDTLDFCDDVEPSDPEEQGCTSSSTKSYGSNN